MAILHPWRLGTLIFIACYFATIIEAADTRESFNSAFDDVKASLQAVQGDTKTALEALEGLKKDVNSGPGNVAKASKILGSVGSALIKLKSGNAYKVVSGCLDIVAGIATTFGGPIGLGVGAVASFVSSILSLFTGSAVKNSMQAVIDGAMKKYRDQELEDEAAGAKRDFAESSAFIESLKKSNKITHVEVGILASNVPIYKFSSFLGKLESRISRGAVTNDFGEAARTIDFILLYSQLVVMRETLLADLCILYKRPGTTDDVANAVNNANKVNREFAHDHLAFLHNLVADNALVGSLYYPIEANPKSQAILEYTKYFGVSKPRSRLYSTKYRFENVYYKWFICSEAYMSNWMFRGCPSRKYPNLAVKPLDNGYYTITNYKSKAMYITKHQQGWAWGTSDRDPGPQGYINIIPLKSGAYLLSTQKWPEYFIYMESSASGYIRSWQGNPGAEGQWNIT